MFKHRLSEFCRVLLLAVCLLFVGGSLQSCKDWLDDYKYDDSEPDWLGASIYAFLKEGTANCTYNHYVELIDSLGEVETLSHTGSKTLFVADDKAFERFFAPGGNPWGVTSIAEMNKVQMKMLLYGSMLNNTLLLDMMANTGANSENEGLCLRRTTSLHELDIVPLVHGESYENHTTWPTYNVYWDNLRGKERGDTLRLAQDGSAPMMVHFLADYLKRNAITVDDINFLFKKKDGVSKVYEEGSVMIYGNKVLNSDVSFGDFSDDTLTIACKNGYIYRMDDVLIPPTNMAGEIRDRKDLRIFSHLLDRFCVPVFDQDLTADYRERHDVNDSVFKLRYFNEADFASYSSLDGIEVLGTELLIFDPGKNDYASGLGLQSDMAAIFVPKDEKLYEFFASEEKGAGNFLLKRYAPEFEIPDTYSEENVDLLLQALDSVPQQNVAPFLNNLMKPSFVNTVKSKFDKITNDANDDMKLREQHVDECIVANNGVIYLLNEVFAPAAYTAVTAPTLVNDNMSIMLNVINQLSYDFYLLAMDAKYTLIVPDDNSFRYFDPVSFEKTIPELYEFRYDNNREKNSKKTAELWSTVYKINAGDLNLRLDSLDNIDKQEKDAYNIGGVNFGGEQFMVNRMTDILEYLIIVHNNNEEKPHVHADKMYYLTKGYGTIKINAENPDEVKFYGGEQLENNDSIVASMVIPEANGVTYCTKPMNEDQEMRLYSSIPAPPRKNVYKNMKANGESAGSLYNEFYKLCTMDGGIVDLADLYEAVLPGESNEIKDQRKDSVRIYSIFYTSEPSASGTNPSTKIIDGVPFLNTYHYTVYIPSNEALSALYAEGFPTWDDVETEMGNKNYGRASSLVRLINSFIRNHFQDNSVYCDKSQFKYLNANGIWDSKASFSTSVIDPTTGRFYENVVKSSDDNSTIIVKDPYLVAKSKNGIAVDDSEWAKVVKTGKENVTWNVMCRDIVFSMSGEDPNGISTSSFSVLQPIDKVLRTPLMYGYDGNFVRYTETGEKVDTMSVSGGKGGLAVDKNGNNFGDNCYLVAKCGKVKITLPDGTEEKVDPNSLDSKSKEHVIAYLLQPKSTDLTNIEKETFINSKKPIITKDGFLVKVVTEKDDKAKETTTYYLYDTVEVDGKVCKQKVDNSGNVIETTEIVTADTNVEE